MDIWPYLQSKYGLWSILAIFAQIIRKTQKNVVFVAFLAENSYFCCFFENFQKIFILPKQKLHSEQLLFWTSSHISTLNVIFGKFGYFYKNGQKKPPKKNMTSKESRFWGRNFENFSKIFFSRKLALNCEQLLFWTFFHISHRFLSKVHFSNKFEKCYFETIKFLIFWVKKLFKIWHTSCFFKNFILKPWVDNYTPSPIHIFQIYLKNVL